jgi:hypothetical protein
MDTHWFAPLPPEPVENEEAVKVSPPDGTRGVTVTRSVLREPMMVMILGAILELRGGVEGEKMADGRGSPAFTPSASK